MRTGKDSPKEDKNKEAFYTWTKKWGWRVNGYLKADKEYEK